MPLRFSLPLFIQLIEKVSQTFPLFFRTNDTCCKDPINMQPFGISRLLWIRDATGKQIVLKACFAKLME